ncbi:MAG: protoporphyrinogen/coproporphyrinogen oxidase, partial [Thermoanaerobaculum sp.]
MSTNTSSLDVIVIGGGISGLAAGFFARQNGKSVLVLEEGSQAGGKIRTDWEDGFCCEWGPQGFLDNVPETLELVRLLGLENRLVKASDAAADRFILRNGKLRKVPLSPPAFLASDVLSLPGKLRVLAEPFIPRGRAEDESVLS